MNDWLSLKEEEKSSGKPNHKRRINMQSPNAKPSKKHCNCNCCLTHPILSFPTFLDHQNSANIDSSTFHYDFATATTSSLYPHTQFTNPDSLPSLQESFRSFTRSFPQYLTTVEADQIRASEYRHLFLSSHVCLDYNGHPLFSNTQQLQDQNNAEFVASTSSSAPYTNVTSFDISNVAKGSSPNLSEFECKLKERIMSYLNVSEDDYTTFFTANQTSAFAVLGESYPFQSNKNLVTVYDHENEAVEALIKSSKSRGARVSSAEFKWPKLKIHCTKLEDMLVGSRSNKKKKRMNKGLFVFPVQSKVSGARYSYQWMNLARENGWHILLDASALGPKEMDTLGLCLFRPDFLICTFYKVFGEDPSGFSCLLVKKSIFSMLNESKISSFPGIVSLIHTKDDQNNEMKGYDIECKGLDQADSLGLVLIGTRVRCLINWLTNALLALFHPHPERGIQLVQVYGPRVKFDRGASLAFNIYDWKGENVDPTLVQKLADRNNISFGCGFLKHVWFSERYEVDREKIMMKGTKEGRRKSSSKEKKNERSESGISVVVANISFLNSFEDVYMVWKFVSKFLDADFVEKERWRYTALNQKSIEV